uniref:von Willebrand factor n=1 Tax=Callorhinchus milii TaxID=7868 RepID=A0A4W3IFQ5_CALMI
MFKSLHLPPYLSDFLTPQSTTRSLRLTGTGLLLGKGKLTEMARCSFFGEHWIQTFDGKIYEFPGDCSYKLASDCNKRSFSLLGNYQGGKRKGISLYLGEYFDAHLTLNGELSVGNKRILLPFASHGVFIGTEAGHYLISSDEYGFTAKIDTTGNVIINLSKKYFGKTCGLCGNYNNFPQDDYMSQEGKVDSSYDFANSWAMHGAEELCTRVSPPSKTCNMSSEALEQCSMLSTSHVFGKCKQQINPETFIATCEDEVCHCEGENCHCHVFLEYARSCAHTGLILHDWSAETGCYRCPAGMEYVECVPTCARTCRSLNINEVCEAPCKDGCMCTGEQLLFVCKLSECSCMHMGRQYPPGSSISQDCHTCICSNAKWECTNENCPGECFAIGQSHFKSFDDKYFTFSGMCQYLMAKDCEDNTFAAYIEKIQCADDPEAVCIRSTTLVFQELGNLTVKLKHGGRVSVNGMDIQTPLIQGGLRIQHTMLSTIRVTYNEDFQFDWDGQGKLSPTYTGSTCGLCGNYNGNQGDDFLTPSGLVESEVVNFGNSWKTNGDCADLKHTQGDPCKLNPKRVRYAEDVCSVLLLTEFEPCHHEVNPAPFLKNCHYDVCACSNGKDCLCSAVSTYAAICARRGVLINWRTPDFCEMTCPEGQIYQQCGSPCNQTCRSLSYPETDCTEFCLEGCYCPPNQYLNEDGHCVQKTECSCYFDGDIYNPHEEISLQYSICYCENGKMHCSTSEFSHAYPPSVFLDESFERDKRDIRCTPPLRTFTCPKDDPTAKGKECIKTCQNYDFECVTSKCMSGCVCPPGQVLYADICIVPYMCPCLHNGKEYRPGETVKKDCNTCECHNRKWTCTHNDCDGTCTAIGEAHYITFDGMKYTFPGKCQYVLVQDICGDNAGTFRILVEHTGCGLPGEECSKIITVLYEGGELELYGREVNVKKSVPNDKDVQILRSGLYYLVVLDKKISILWDMGTRVSVQINGQYKDKVCGLCGNFDGNENNDLVGSGNQLEIESIDFGNSWTVNYMCANTPSLCSDNSLKQALVESSCNIIKSALFAECATLVNPQPYWEICMYDTCSCDATGECLCLCNAISGYAHECAQHGVVVHWRTANLCPISCEELNSKRLDYVCEWRYNACAPACPVSCQHPEQTECPLTCVEGCHAYCPSGTILDEDSQTCISPEHCPVCILEDKRIPSGQTTVVNKGTGRCQICLCNGTSLHCEDCPAVEIPVPETNDLPLIELPPDEGCHKVMELAFLIDGSTSFSRQQFEVVKRFVLEMMKQMQIGQSNIRVAVLQFHVNIQKYFDLWEKKNVRQLRKIVETLPYIGFSRANLYEALKHASILVFGRDARKDVPRIAILLTGSTSSKDIKGALKFIIKKKVTVISIGIGPGVNQKEINMLTKKSPGGKSFTLNDVEELEEQRDAIFDYMCSRGAPTPTIRPTTSYSTTTQTVTSSPSTAVLDVVFLLEGSDKVGESNFNRSKEFIMKTVEKFQVSKPGTQVSVIQYSDAVNEELTFTSTQDYTEVLERIKQMKFRGGEQTNTGNALMHVIESTFTMQNSDREETPNLVFMITSNPPTDNIRQSATALKEKNVELIPIIVGNDVTLQDIDPFGDFGPPIQTNYTDIVNMSDVAFKVCCQPSTQLVTVATTPASVRTPAPPSGKTPPRHYLTFFFNKHYLFSKNLEFKGRKAVSFMFENMMTESQGARPGVPKIALVIVMNTDVSEDDLVSAADEASVNGVSVFPIGIGREYDQQQLRILTGPLNENNIIQLDSTENLLTMVTISNQFNLSKECIDDKGNRRQAGEKWLLPDKCHSLTCKPNGEILSTSHRINCEKLRKPTCSNNLPNIKIEETCGCRWACPCTCTGSSNKQMTTFDGRAFSLNGNCSYLLLQVEGQNTQIVLHKVPCIHNLQENCFTAIEVQRHNTTILLHDDMTISVNGKLASTPFHFEDVLIVQFGSTNLVADIRDLDTILVFSPTNDLFAVGVSPTLFFTKTSGICGKCDNNQLNDFELQDGSLTNDTLKFIQEWTLKESALYSCNDKAPVVPRPCETESNKCSVLLSSTFAACHDVVDVQPYLTQCRQDACDTNECASISAYSFRCQLHRICVTWRTDNFCPMQCSASMVYEPCRLSCTHHCDSITNSTQCLDSPTEGCFCPEGKLLLEGKCVTDEACTECTDDQGTPHQYLDTWISQNNPCQLCMCLANRQINCTSKPCPTLSVPRCQPCEIPKISHDVDNCCSQYECVCDLPSCNQPAIPKCEDGLSLSLKNPGACLAAYECVCSKDQCETQSVACPPHRAPYIRKTQCCDKYECVCSCENVEANCPVGYSVKSMTNDCNCTTSACEPNEVCVHNGALYQVGSTWEESCKECSCTERKDSVTGLHIVQCARKTCIRDCPVGYTYTEENGACCGKCRQSMCEYTEIAVQRGDVVPQKHLYAGEQWESPNNPCMLMECLMVNGEVVLHEKNAPCNHANIPECPLGHELSCRDSGCCPVCHCGKFEFRFIFTSLIFSPKFARFDNSFKYSTAFFLDEICGGYVPQKEIGSCCGKCVATGCLIQLKNETRVKLNAGENLQDGCDRHKCKVNDKGEFSWEKQTTVCPSFDHEECKSDGGEVVPVENTCCFTCEPQLCRKITGVVQYIRIDDCMTENEVNIHYCEGRCSSKSAYSVQNDGVQNQCVCCSATASTKLLVPLKCQNGTVLHHEVTDMQECACVSRQCE